MPGVRLDVVEDADHFRVVVTAAGREAVRLDAPVGVETTDGGETSTSYDEAVWVDSELRCSASVESGDGTALRVDDVWSANAEGDGYVVRRSWTVLRSGTSTGVRTELVADALADPAGTGHRYFVSGCVYNRNDTDLDGTDDYLGAGVREFRDDRNGALAVLAYDPSSGLGTCLARTTAPAFDVALTEEQLRSGIVVADTDIGSLGVIESRSSSRLRASFPFREERGFSLHIDGRGWTGFLPVVPGMTGSVEYELRFVVAPDLTGAIWDVVERQRSRLGTAPTELPMPMEELERYRFELTQQYFRAWDALEDPRAPAGYLTHFSPREGRTLGSVLEFGFTGAQTLLALGSMRRGYREGVPLWVSRARLVNDFFVNFCQAPNGYSEGLYDTRTRSFLHWFTGILMPFQYSDDDDELRDYLGTQITTALAPIARELRDVQGNYLRTMCEAVYAVVRSYQEDLKHGVSQPRWLEAGQRFAEFLLEHQSPDGSWARAYSPDGRALTHPAEWFGRGPVEQSSGTLFPVPVLALLHELTGDRRLLAAIERAADFIARTYVPEVLYCGGLNDTAMLKSVKADSTGALFAMRALVRGFQVTGRPEHLAAAVKAAKIAASWVFLWNVPFPEGTLLREHDFRTTGWAVCDAIPGGSYVEDVFLEFLGDLAQVAALAGEPGLFDFVELVAHGMQQGLSTPRDMWGYAAPGIQCEGVMTSYWLSAPEETAFSGAVGKVKGDDNDTCNGFVNAAAMYGLDALRSAFGTVNLREIRAAVGLDRRA